MLDIPPPLFILSGGQAARIIRRGDSPVKMYQNASILKWNRLRENKRHISTIEVHYTLRNKQKHYLISSETHCCIWST